MAKVGYIYLAEGYEDAEQDMAWMNRYGCVKVMRSSHTDGKRQLTFSLLLINSNQTTWKVHKLATPS